jgi:hypothetical protein
MSCPRYGIPTKLYRPAVVPRKLHSISLKHVDQAHAQKIAGQTVAGGVMGVFAGVVACRKVRLRVHGLATTRTGVDFAHNDEERMTGRHVELVR